MEPVEIARLPDILSATEASARYGPPAPEGPEMLQFRRWMLDLGEEQSDRALNAMELDLDGSEDSLVELDSLHLVGPAMPEEAQEALVAGCAAYLGGLIIEQLGGDWRFRKDLDHVAVGFPRLGVEVFPVHVIRKLLVLGKPGLVTGFYEGLVKALDEAP